jgi:hypothetical protein
MKSLLLFLSGLIAGVLLMALAVSLILPPIPAPVQVALPPPLLYER